MNESQKAIDGITEAFNEFIKLNVDVSVTIKRFREIISGDFRKTMTDNGIDNISEEDAENIKKALELMMEAIEKELEETP